MTERDDGLERMTMRQLRELAKAEGICLGYDGSRKDTAIGAIREQRHHRQWLKDEGAGE